MKRVLKDARALARQDRALLQQGTDVAAAKQLDKLKACDIHTVENLSEAWYARHIKPVIGKLPVEEVRPLHVDHVLTKIVDAVAPTVANDALRYLVRMFHFAVKRRLIETNPAFGFDNSDAGGAEALRVRWMPSFPDRSGVEPMNPQARCSGERVFAALPEFDISCQTQKPHGYTETPMSQASPAAHCRRRGTDRVEKDCRDADSIADFASAPVGRSRRRYAAPPRHIPCNRIANRYTLR